MPRINLSQYQFTISDPFQAGHIMTELEAQILNGHRADLIRKIVGRWVTDAEQDAVDGVLSIKELDNLTESIIDFDSTYSFSPRIEPKLPAFDYQLHTIAVGEVLKEGPAHLIPDYDERIKQAMRDPANKERARKRLVTSIRSIYGTAANG